MANNNNKPNPKHINSFWALFIVVIVSMVAGGIIYAFAFGNQLQDNVDSSFFLPRFMSHKCVATAKVKCPTPTAKTQAK